MSNERERCCLGIDIGGTSAKLGIVAATGQILQRTSAVMCRSQPANILLEGLSRSAAQLVQWSGQSGLKLEGIGIGHPGFYDERGTLRDLCNLPSLNGTNIANFLGNELHLPAKADTDVSCGTLGEFTFGGHEGIRRFLFLTLGTGVGAGAVVDGHLMRTTRNCLGEPGHIIVDPDGSPCSCGGHGCLEAVVSGWAIARVGNQIATDGRSTVLSECLHTRGEITPEDVFDAALRADPAAQQVVARVSKYLAMGLASLTTIIEPERIVLGGGIAAGAGDQLLNEVRKNFFHVVSPPFARNTHLMTARVGPDAGVLGAATLILDPKVQGASAKEAP